MELSGDSKDDELPPKTGLLTLN